MSPQTFNFFHVGIKIFEFFPSWPENHDWGDIFVGSRIRPVAVVGRADLLWHRVAVSRIFVNSQSKVADFEALHHRSRLLQWPSVKFCVKPHTNTDFIRTPQLGTSITQSNHQGPIQDPNEAHDDHPLSSFWSEILESRRKRTPDQRNSVPLSKIKPQGIKNQGGSRLLLLYNASTFVTRSQGCPIDVPCTTSTYYAAL